MPECLREDLRELLPMLAAGQLAGADLAKVRQHLEACASCSAEFALLGTARRVLLAQTPRLDVDRIAAAVNAPVLKVVRGSAEGSPAARHPWLARRYVAAAASLLVVGSLSLAVVRVGMDGGTAVESDTLAAATAQEGATGLSVAGGLADLSDEDLSALLEELDSIEGTVVAEPPTLRTPIVDAPEGT